MCTRCEEVSYELEQKADIDEAMEINATVNSSGIFTNFIKIYRRTSANAARWLGSTALFAALLFLLFFIVHYCNYVLCRASRSNFTARTREPKYRKNLWKCEKMS